MKINGTGIQIWFAEYIIKNDLSVSDIKKIIKYHLQKSKDNFQYAAEQVVNMKKNYIKWDEEVFPRKKEKIDYEYEYSSVVKSFTNLFEKYKLLKKEKGETVEEWILHAVNFHTAKANSDKENLENINFANMQSTEIKIEFADKESEYPKINTVVSTQE